MVEASDSMIDRIPFTIGGRQSTEREVEVALSGYKLMHAINRR